MAYLRLVPATTFAAVIAVMAALHVRAPVRQLLETPWRWIGAVPMLAGLALAVWAAIIFRIVRTTFWSGDTPRLLITHGPYRLSRNPMYLSMIMMLAGLALMLGSLTPWLCVPVFPLVIAWLVIPAEEAVIRRSFGGVYDEYRAQVRRWI